jgi:anti-sigma-K factor RskA
MSSHQPAAGCEECVDAAPYVLGALELEEAERYREHLGTCATCRAAVAELQLAVDALPTTVPPTVVSAAMRERVLATVRSEAELLRASGHQADQPANPPGLWRSRRISLLATGVAIAAGVAVAAAIAINSGSSTRELVTPGHLAASVHGGHASLRQIDGRGELVVSGIPQPPLGKIYEVWLSGAAGSPQPTDALFSVTSRGSGSVNIPGGLHGVKEVLVTSEPLGGSSHPTSPPLIRVPVGT